MTYVVIIKTILGDMAGVYGPFDSPEQARAWINAEIDTDLCLTTIYDLASPILEKV